MKYVVGEAALKSVRQFFNEIGQISSESNIYSMLNLSPYHKYPVFDINFMFLKTNRECKTYQQDLNSFDFFFLGGGGTLMTKYKKTPLKNAGNLLGQLKRITNKARHFPGSP